MAFPKRASVVDDVEVVTDLADYFPGTELDYISAPMADREWWIELLGAVHAAREELYRCSPTVRELAQALLAQSEGFDPAEAILLSIEQAKTEIDR